jgi:glycosyltransferase involved in cell wall biosynthesis
MISPEFPPVGGGATTRVTKLVRYLAREGVQLEVLTAPPGPQHPLDSQRLKEVEGLVRIHQAEPPQALMQGLAWLYRDTFRGALRLYHLIEPGFPDRLCWWCLGAWKQARQAARRAQVVWTTGPPYGAHLLGYVLRSLHRLPWVMDCRDPWTQNFIYRHRGVRRRIEEAFEGHLLRRADRVVAVTETLVEQLSRRFGAEVVHLSNGFDPEDLPPIAPTDAKVRRLIYAGVLNEYRDPEPLARAILGLGRSDLCLELFGPVWRELGPALRELQRRGQLQVQGALPHREALASLAAADVAVVLGEADPRADVAVGGKVYELLALGVPILGLVVPGEMCRLLEAGGARVAHPQDEQAIACCLAEMLVRPREVRPQAGCDHPQAYPRLARQLLDILQQVARPR